MKVVLVRFKDGQRRDVALSDDKNTLGRGEDCTLRIPIAQVSRHHCEVVVGRQNCTVRDLGSSNGTFVNGKRVAEAKLKPGDQIMMGPVIFVVQIDGRPATIRAEDVHPGPDDSAAGTGATKLTDDDSEPLLDLDDFEIEDDDDDSPPKKR